jgi:pimeloyl-ACP methyl ester carboxylesterase
VDFLVTQPRVDRQRIALAGHALNGKQALMAGFFDERFSALILSSSGTGGACSFRLFSETQSGEGIEMLTRHFPDWFHPRLRFFAGRENKLPVDQNEMVAGLAPRPCLISLALHDPQESLWAVEHTYYSARRVYEFLGATGALNLRYRSGGQEILKEDVEAYLDWLDTQFGRGQLAVASRPLLPTYADWLKGGNEPIDPQQFPLTSSEDLLTSAGGNVLSSLAQWQTKREDIRRRIGWGLGSAPPGATSGSVSFPPESVPGALRLDRGSLPAGFEKQELQFGQGIQGDLYLPSGLAEKGETIPAVIWLHPLACATGYATPGRDGEAVHLALVRQGVAVLAFDQIGNGTRLEEAARFYARYPRWSLAGKTVQETSSAVDALSRHPRIDPRRILVMGYSLGAMAALHAAALDDRIAGVIAVAGVTLLRSDTQDQGTGGISRWSHWLVWQPRLGAFIGNESRIPYDYHEVLAAIAPRPVLVVSPWVDYQSGHDQAQRCVSLAEKVYTWLGAKENLAWLTVNDYNHFSTEMQQKVFAQLPIMLGRLAPRK